jgi:hypothetical protein
VAPTWKVDKFYWGKDQRTWRISRSLPELTRQQSGMYTDLTNTTACGLALFDDPNGTDAARVRDMHEFFVWMGKELPASIDRWYAEHPSRAVTRDRPEARDPLCDSLIQTSSFAFSAATSSADSFSPSRT